MGALNGDRILRLISSSIGTESAVLSVALLHSFPDWREITIGSAQPHKVGMRFQ